MPASKGDVFRSRALSPSDKRVLMRFLKACGDAIEGRGHLKVPSSSSVTACPFESKKRSACDCVAAVGVDEWPLLMLPS